MGDSAMRPAQQESMSARGYGQGVAVADYDGDGDDDLLITNFEGRNVLYANQGDGTFQDRTEPCRSGRGRPLVGKRGIPGF